MRILLFLVCFLLLLPSLNGEKKRTKKWKLRSEQNRHKCEKFCGETKECVKCSTIRHCGVGLKKIKTFQGRGRNYTACRKEGHINRIWPKHNKVMPHHRYLIVSIGGFYGRFGDDGFEWFCEDYLTEKVAPKALCISAYAKPSNSSKKLADNILKLADKMKQVSGVPAKIFLVGKSLGGCKLHHAVSGEYLADRSEFQKRNIELFVGVDISCSIKRHFEDENDYLEFRDNVKNLLIFYQDLEVSKQTGHRAEYNWGLFNDELHVNVNQEGYDVTKRKKIKNPTEKQLLCKGADHAFIDDCKNLKETIRDIILKMME